MDIELSPDESEEEAKITDKRNIIEYYRKLKKYNYPANDCHHINLDFIGVFENLKSFHIEFAGEGAGTPYHPRHFNFSHDDIKHLASGNVEYRDLFFADLFLSWIKQVYNN
mgnify:CR=1 FL=1